MKLEMPRYGTWAKTLRHPFRLSIGWPIITFQLWGAVLNIFGKVNTHVSKLATTLPYMGSMKLKLCHLQVLVTPPAAAER